MPKHRSGGKFTNAHTTLIEAACAPIDAAAKLACVNKISLGVISATRSKLPRIRFTETSTGLEVKIFSKISSQTFYIFTTDKHTTQSVMYRAFKQ